LRNGKHAQQHDEQRDDPGKDGPVNEELWHGRWVRVSRRARRAAEKIRQGTPMHLKGRPDADPDCQKAGEWRKLLPVRLRPAAWCRQGRPSMEPPPSRLLSHPLIRHCRYDFIFMALFRMPANAGGTGKQLALFRWHFDPGNVEERWR
jgi:hypothetical protein